MNIQLSKEIKVGILSVSAIALFYFGFNYMKGIDFFSPTRSYFTVYEEIGGLTISNPVLLSGKPVGRVAEIEILQASGNKVLVTFEVNKEIKIGNDATAVLSNVDLLGSQAIILKIPPVSETINKNDTIPGIIDLTVTEKLQQQALPLLENFEQITTKMTEVMDIVTKNETNISSTVENVKNISKNIENITKQNEQQVTAIIKNLSEVAAMLNDEKDGIKAILNNVSSVTDSIKAADIKKTIANIDSTITYVNSTLEKATKSGGNVDKLLSDDQMYENFNRSLEDLDRLLIDVQENPKRYVHFSIFGRKDKK